ncbi:DnaA/Hda family protein [Pseudogemmatithrix spongiicola]|uniref:Chromosomal replication initiator protein DnaA n=1 Tax=Pseudogemmatithrix spongiicola TaxID=3062599 RepID=A0AA49Q8A1_9BACT|nr:DnaA/Hda family protein [Gemmatimonadaceae bacterium 'strain 138']WKW14895.1 DnaA/Hda family protein [Gemmatimonadaceae bacterium 'strain 318']
MRLDPRFTFDRLVVGAANRLAAAAARAVAEAPGTTYNPLFIYGGSGLGKTHLLTATAHLLQQLQPRAEVLALTLDEFSEQYHAAVSAGETSAFGHRLAHVDLLLLDDLQFVTGRREMQAELLRLFTVMQDGNRQIVCACDRPPSEIADVDERLISRLAGGLVVDVGLPEFEARVAILRAAIAERELAVPDAAITRLAERGISSVRELQGLLNQWIAQEAMGGKRMPTPMPGNVDALRPSGEFLSFLSDVAAVVQEQVETWQVRLRETIAYWKGEGYRTAVLERALTLPTEPDVQGLIAVYVQAVDHLRSLEREATAVDGALGGHELFRDPERLAEAEEFVEKALAGEMPPGGPNPAFTREGFDVGAANQLAVHAADAVIATPGTRYNPLLITGPSGVGKTHLVHAIGNAIAARSEGRVAVACVHAQALVDELIAAIQQGTVERWRSRYRAAGALVIDDIQFLAGKERTQDEFFFVFNALIEEGKQIILSSDRAPGEIPDLAARLRSRFEGGLIAEIQPPDRPLREKLAARFLAGLGRAAPPDLLDVICDPTVRSVRELIGVVNRLAAAADALGQPLDAVLARQELGLGAAASATIAPPAAAASAGDRTFLDRERVVWEWADLSGRVIEELR